MTHDLGNVLFGNYSVSFALNADTLNVFPFKTKLYMKQCICLNKLYRMRPMWKSHSNTKCLTGFEQVFFWTFDYKSNELNSNSKKPQKIIRSLFPITVFIHVFFSHECDWVHFSASQCEKTWWIVIETQDIRQLQCGWLTLPSSNQKRVDSSATNRMRGAEPEQLV